MVRQRAGVANVVEHALVLARGSAIVPEHLPPPVPPTIAAGGVREEALAEMVRQWTELQLQDSRREAENLYERLLAVVEPPLLAAVLRITAATAWPRPSSSACTAPPCERS